MDQRVDVDAHVREIVALHFDPGGGAPFWLDRQKALGIDVRREIRSLADMARLGPMDEEALRTRSMLDFVPRSRRARLAGALVAETGGTTGTPKRTLFSPEEFREAFVTPFIRVAEATGFPREVTWLWAGPGGPHIIGQAAAACAAAMGSPQPLSIDFDPRWFRKLPSGSLGRERYFEHLLEQAVDALSCEQVEVVFTTPAVLEKLHPRMSGTQRKRIRGIHYGGMRVAPDLLRAAQEDWFPNAVHLAGYGNSLFGVCMEFGGSADRRLAYYPFGVRHQVRVDGDGRVWMSRLDSTILIANLPERDRATALPAPSEGRWRGFGAGVEDPRPLTDSGSSSVAGIY